MTMKVFGALALVPLLVAGSASAEVSEVNISHHPGIGYLTGPVMSHEKLVEKHAEQLGLRRVTGAYRISGGATQSMEAVISGTVDFAIAGLTPVIIAWSKTKGEILGVAAANTANLVLVHSLPGN
jgi:NitT/TauT family transport system substrate-binding protein